MSTSGSIDFSLTRNEIITEALEILGVVGTGETPTDAQYTSCARTLNMMIKHWNGSGIHMWTLEEMELALVVDQASYTLSPRPLHVKNVRFRNDDADPIDRPCRIDSRTDYFNIANKSTSGKINRVYYDAQVSTGVLYVWPVPDSADDTLQITYARSLEDFDASSDNADLPQEWLETISLNLAVRVAPKFGKNLAKTDPYLAQRAALALEEMSLWDTEASKTRVVPARNENE